MSSATPENPSPEAGKSDIQHKPIPGPGLKRPTIIVFTDLDGTLLDTVTYSFEPAKPALRRLQELTVPLVLCSGKTRREIESYRAQLGVSDPFVAENGGGIFIPKGYFPPGITVSEVLVEERGNYEVIGLGTAYPRLRRAMEQLRREGFLIRGFGDMTPQQVAQMTGLTLEEAVWAKEREFDEPLVLDETADVDSLRGHIERLGLRLTKGALYHMVGESDKGRAVSLLCDLYRRSRGSIVTIGVGDSLNDAEMLAQVDYPVLVQKPDGSHDPDVSIPNVVRVDGMGPSGWNKAVLSLLAQLDEKGAGA